MIVRRGTQLVVGAVLLVLATMFTLLASVGGANGADAERCAEFSFQSQARERLVTGHGRPVVVIGDSYSVGLGLRDPQGSWPSRLPGRVHVYGFSGSGFSAHASPCPHVAYAARAPQALSAGAGIVVVEGGLNDYDQPDSALRSGFRALMRRLRGHEVLLVGPPPAPARAASARRVDQVLRAESKRQGVHYVSMARHRFSYLDDGLHLTPTGHQAFGAVVAHALGRVKP